MTKEAYGYLESDFKQYARIAEIVNPANESLQVLYPGSGGDLLAPLLTINSDTLSMVELYSLQEGYFGGPFTGRMSEEASKLGINAIEIAESEEPSTINFKYRHPNDTVQSVRSRVLTFHNRDYSEFWPKEFDEGYDILITKGEAPTFDTHDIQMKQLIDKMRVGGYFISDRELAWVIPPEFIGFIKLPISGIEFACGPVQLYKKVEQVKEETASQLFTINDLLRTSLDLESKTVWFEPTLLGKRPDILAQFPQIPMSYYEDQVYVNATKLEDSLMAIAERVRTLPENMTQKVLAGIGLYYLGSDSPIVNKTFRKAFAGF